MTEKYTFTILGGDRRQAVVARRLSSLGHSVRIFGLGEFSAMISGAEIFSSAEKAISESNVVILPLPVSRDYSTLNLSTVDKKDSPTLTDIIKHTSKNNSPIILGGMIPQSMKISALNSNVEIIDYYESESLQKRNALPSAEGALMVAMENTDKVIEGMHVLVSGYGRIGMLIAEKLKKLGAQVSVAVRRDEVMCEISMSGYVPVKTTDLKEMSDVMGACDVIFNTVPSVIFTKNMLDIERPKPLYIEIASSPGGIDIPAARELGYQILFAPSLPGKYAPISAGEYIFETIHDILIQRGMKI